MEITEPTNFMLNILRDSENHNYFFVVKLMIQKGWLNNDGYLTDAGRAFVHKDTQSKSKITELEMSNLVDTLRDIYPVGIKNGTTKTWKGTPKEVEKKLYSFFKKYPDVTTDEVIKATKKYINTSTAVYRRVLPYFIEKDNNSDLYEMVLAFRDAEKAGTNMTEASNTDDILDWGHML